MSSDSTLTSQPSPHETSGCRQTTDDRAWGSSLAATLPELTHSKPCLAVLPIGSFEQHGGHLPLATDGLIAGLIAQELARELRVLLLPTLPFSCSHEHAGFPYSVSMSSTTLSLVVKDLLGSLERSGITFTILVNGHGGNYVLGNVAQELNQDRPQVLVLPTRQQWQTAMAHAGITATVSEDMHGGEIETSLMLHAYPHLVQQEQIRDHEATDRPWLQLLGMKHYTDHGIIGFPSRATAQKGKCLLTALVAAMCADIRMLLAGPLSER